MKVFISWSGDISHKIALALRKWIPSVIQCVDVHVSSEDIAKGDVWVQELRKNLEESDFGILCITRENLGKPWVNFEAGVLSDRKVSPFLFGVEPSEIDEPLRQFQCTRNNKEDVRQLIVSINKTLGSAELEKGRLDSYFEDYWSRLEGVLSELSSGPEKPQYLDHRNLCANPEIVRNVRISEVVGDDVWYGGLEFLRSKPVHHELMIYAPSGAWVENEGKKKWLQGVAGCLARALPAKEWPEDKKWPDHELCISSKLLHFKGVYGLPLGLPNELEAVDVLEALLMPFNRIRTAQLLYLEFDQSTAPGTGSIIFDDQVFVGFAISQTYLVDYGFCIHDHEVTARMCQWFKNHVVRMEPPVPNTRERVLNEHPIIQDMRFDIDVRTGISNIRARFRRMRIRPA